MTHVAAADLGARFAAAGIDWIVPAWDVPAAVRAFATTRNGGSSTGSWATLNLGRRSDDDAAALAANRARLAEYLPGAPVWLHQVHGTNVAVLGHDAPAAPPVADAAVTRVPGVVCAVLTADCLPVLFAARNGAAVGVAHAGWRGLAAGVLEATVAALANLGAHDVIAWLGPAIGPDAFEVGADVHAAFCAADPDAVACFRPHCAGKWHADLYALARRRLVRAGVTSIVGGDACTHAEPARFFSHRRDRTTARQATVVWLDDACV